MSIQSLINKAIENLKRAEQAEARVKVLEEAMKKAIAQIEERADWTDEYAWDIRNELENILNSQE